ncbi:MAG: DrmE family protein, partial [Clostridia bacterium]|nr:DrmE family protein [Clostridia bacterium]
SGNNSATAECVASAIFENDDRGFFTKRYKAYVIDKATGEAYEKDVEKLAEGDSLIFTINNANTRDIVDDMLQKLIGSLGEKTQESYRKSKEWKQILKEYTEVVGAKETLRALKRTGIPVQISTIRHWLDPDSHQVGLRAIDSFRAVGLVTGHTEMFEHPEVYYEACADVKRVRGEILKYIGEAIIKKISGIVPKLGDIMAEVYDRLDSSAVVLRIESIREINMEIPINLVNRPITMKE